MRRKLSLKKINKLTEKALKNKPELKPAKGFKYLKDLPIGSLFETYFGTRGILLSCETNARVLITNVLKRYDELESSKGKAIIGSETEVKEIK